MPVSRGSGLLWLSGPRGDLPRANTPASSAGIQAMRPFAEANPGLMQQLADTMRAFAALVEREPDRAKAAMARLHPDVDAATMDVLFAAEANAWTTRPLTRDDMQHEIRFVRSGAAALPGLDRLDPAAMLYVPPGR